MINEQTRHHQSLPHLTEVLHTMLMKSRTNQTKPPMVKKGQTRFSMQNSLPSGDPPVTTLWGE